MLVQNQEFQNKFGMENCINQSSVNKNPSDFSLQIKLPGSDIVYYLKNSSVVVPFHQEVSLGDGAKVTVVWSEDQFSVVSDQAIDVIVDGFIDTHNMDFTFKGKLDLNARSDIKGKCKIAVDQVSINDNISLAKIVDIEAKSVSFNSEMMVGLTSVKSSLVHVSDSAKVVSPYVKMECSTIKNEGVVKARIGLNIDAEDIINNGSLSASTLVAKVKGQFLNENGNVTAQKMLDVSANFVYNTGRMSSAGYNVIKSKNYKDTKEASLTASKSLLISSEKAEFSGELKSRNLTAVTDRLRVSTNLNAKKINIDTKHLSLHDNAHLMLPVMDAYENEVDQEFGMHSLKVRDSVVVSKGSSLTLHNTQADIGGDISLEGELSVLDSNIQSHGKTHVSKSGALSTSYSRWLGEHIASDGRISTQETSMSVNGMDINSGSAKFGSTTLDVANMLFQNTASTVSYNQSNLNIADFVVNGVVVVDKSKINTDRLYSEGKVDVFTSLVRVKNKLDFNKGANVNIEDRSVLQADCEGVFDGDFVAVGESTVKVKNAVVGGRFGLDHSSFESANKLNIDRAGMLDSRNSSLSSQNAQINGELKTDGSKLNFEALTVKGSVDAAKSIVGVSKNIVLEKSGKLSLAEKTKLKANNLLSSGSVSVSKSAVNVTNIEQKAGSIQSQHSDLHIDASLIQEAGSKFNMAATHLDAKKMIYNGNAQLKNSKLKAYEYFAVDKDGKFNTDQVLLDLNVAQWYGDSVINRSDLSADRSSGHGVVEFNDSNIAVDDEFRTSRNANLYLNNTRLKSKQALLSGQSSIQRSSLESDTYDQRGFANFSESNVAVKDRTFIDQTGTFNANNTSFTGMGDFVVGCNVNVLNTRINAKNYWQEGCDLQLNQAEISAENEIYFSENSSAHVTQSRIAAQQMSSFGLFESELSKIESDNAGFYNETLFDRSVVDNKQHLMLGPQSNVTLKNGAHIKSKGVDVQGKVSLAGQSAIDALKAFEVRYKASVEAEEASRISAAKLSNFGDMKSNQSQFVAKEAVVAGRMNLTNHSDASMKKLKAEYGSQVNAVDSILHGQHAEVDGQVKIKDGVMQFEDSIKTGMNSGVKLDHAQVKTADMIHAGDLQVKNGAQISATNVFETKTASTVSGDDLKINAHDVILRGDMEGFDSLGIKSENTEVYGTVSSDILSVTAENSLFNQGFMYAERMNLDSDFVTNQGLMSADSNLTITSLATTNVLGGTIYCPNTTINALVYTNAGGIVSAYNLNKNTLVDLNYGLELPSLANVEDILSPQKVWSVAKMAVKAVSAPLGNALDIAHRVCMLPGQISGIVDQAQAMYNGGQENFRLRSALPLVLNVKNIAVSAVNTASELGEMASDGYEYAKSDFSMQDVKEKLTENLNKEGLTKAASFVAKESVGIFAPMVNQESVFSMNGGFVGSYNVNKSDYFSVNLGNEYAYNRLNHNSNIMFNGGRAHANEVIYTAQKFVNDGHVTADARLKGDFHEAQLREGSKFNTSGNVDLNVKTNLDIQGQAILGDKSKGSVGKIKVGEKLSVSGEGTEFKLSGVEAIAKKAELGSNASIVEGSVLDARETHIQRGVTLHVDETSSHYTEKMLNQGFNRNEGKFGDVVRDQSGKIASHVSTKEYANDQEAWSLFRGEAEIETMKTAGNVTLLDQAKVKVDDYQQTPQGKTYLYDQSKLTGANATLAGITEANDQSTFGMDNTVVDKSGLLKISNQATQIGQKTLVEQGALYKVDGVAHGGVLENENGEKSVQKMEQVTIKEGARAEVAGEVIAKRIDNESQLKIDGGAVRADHLKQGQKASAELTNEAMLESKLIENANVIDVKDSAVRSDKFVQGTTGKTTVAGHAALASKEAELGGTTQVNDESTYAVENTVIKEKGSLTIGEKAQHVGKKTVVEKAGTYKVEGVAHGGVVKNKDGKLVAEKMEQVTIKEGARAEVKGEVITKRIDNESLLKMDGGTVRADHLKQGQKARAELTNEAMLESKLIENANVIDVKDSAIRSDKFVQATTGKTTVAGHSALASKEAQLGGATQVNDESTYAVENTVIKEKSSLKIGKKAQHVGKKTVVEKAGTYKVEGVAHGGVVKDKAGKNVVQKMEQVTIKEGARAEVAGEVIAKRIDNESLLKMDGGTVRTDHLKQGQKARAELTNEAMLESKLIENANVIDVKDSAVRSDKFVQATTGKTTVAGHSALASKEAQLGGATQVNDESTYAVENTVIKEKSSLKIGKKAQHVGKKTVVEKAGTYKVEGVAHGGVVKDKAGKNVVQKMEQVTVKEGAQAQINGTVISEKLNSDGAVKSEGGLIQADHVKQGKKGKLALSKQATLKSKVTETAGEIDANNSLLQVDHLKQDKTGKTKLQDNSTLKGEKAEMAGTLQVEKQSTVMVKQMTTLEGGQTKFDKTSRDFGDQRKVQGTYKNDGLGGKLVTNEKGETKFVSMDEMSVDKKGKAELNGTYKAVKMTNDGEVTSDGGRVAIDELNNNAQSKLALKNQAVWATKNTANHGQIASDSSVFMGEKVTQSKDARTEMNNGSFFKANTMVNDGTNVIQGSAVVTDTYNQGEHGNTLLNDGSSLKGNRSSIQGKLAATKESRFEVEDATVEKNGRVTFDETSLDLGKKRKITGAYKNDGKAGQLVKDSEGKARLEKMEHFEVEGSAEINGVLKAKTLTNKRNLSGQGAHVETDHINSEGGSEANFKRSTIKSDTASMAGKFSAEDRSQFTVRQTHVKQGGQLDIVDSMHEGDSVDNDGIYRVKGKLEESEQGKYVTASVKLKDRLHNKGSANLDTAIVDTGSFVSEGDTRSKDLTLKAKNLTVKNAWDYEGYFDADVEEKFTTDQNSKMRGHGESKFNLKAKTEDMQGHHSGDSMSFDIDEFDNDTELDIALSWRKVRVHRKNNAQELLRGTGRFERIQTKNIGVKTKRHINMSGLRRGPGVSYDVEASSINVNEKLETTGLRLKSTQGDININADVSAVKGHGGGNGSGNISLESEQNINVRGSDNKKQEPTQRDLFLKRFGFNVPAPQDLKPDEVSVSASGHFNAKAKGDFHNKNAKINAGETACVTAKSIKNERTHKDASAEIAGKKVLLNATEGDVDNNGALKATEFLGVQAKGNINNNAFKYTEAGQYDTLTRYDAAIMQGGTGTAETGGVGASISAEKQVYNDASKMTAIGDTHVHGKEGVQSIARYNTYVNDRWDKKSGIGGHKRNRGHSTHTDEYVATIQSENGKNVVTSENGGIKTIGTQFLSPHGTQIVAKNKIELLAAIYNDTRIERKSGGWGVANNREESHNEGAIPTVVATINGIVYVHSYEDGVDGKGVIFMGTSDANLVVKGKKDVVLANEKLKHQVKTQSEGFSLDAPGLKLAEGAQKGKIGEGLIDEDPLLSSIRSTARSHNNVERGVNAFNTGVEGAAAYNQFKDVNPVDGAINRYAKASVSYSQEKSELNYETKGPGGIHGFGHMHLESEEGNVILNMDANVHNASIKAKKAFIQNATELESSFKHEKNSVSVSASATSAGPAYGASHSHMKSKDVNYVNSRLNVAGHLEVNAESWEMNGANTNVGTLGGEVKKFVITDMMDTHEAKGESYSGSTDGQVGVGKTNESSKRVRESSGLHVREGINKADGPQFKAGQTHINGAGNITSDGENNYEKTNGPITRTALEEHDRVESYQVSANPGQIASGKESGMATIGVQKRDYKATLDQRGRTVHNDEEYNFTLKVPVPKRVEEPAVKPKVHDQEAVKEREGDDKFVDPDVVTLNEFDDTPEVTGDVKGIPAYLLPEYSEDIGSSPSNNNAGIDLDNYGAEDPSNELPDTGANPNKREREQKTKEKDGFWEKQGKKVLKEGAKKIPKEIAEEYKQQADDLRQNKTQRSKQARNDERAHAKKQGDHASKKDLKNASRDSNLKNRQEIDAAESKAKTATKVAKGVKYGMKAYDFYDDPVKATGKTILEDGSKAAAPILKNAGGKVLPALGKGLGWFAGMPVKIVTNLLFEADDIGPEESVESFYQKREAEERWREMRRREDYEDRHLTARERVLKQFKLDKPPEPPKQETGPTIEPYHGPRK